MARKNQPVALDETEFAQLLTVTKEMEYKIAFLIAFEAGLKLSEILKLQQGDIDNKYKTIRIGESIGGNNARVIKLPEDWKYPLTEFLPLKNGMRATQKAFKKYAQVAGILSYKPTANFNSLRYGFATRYAQNGMDIRMIRDIMGHNSLSTTGKYILTTQEEALAQAIKIQRALFDEE